MLLLPSTLSSLLLLLAAAGSTWAQDTQIRFDAIHNRSTIIGTWSSGSRGVVTGPGFVNPVAYSFNYPKTTGISYSFSDDGFFEEAHYRFKGNATDPRCIVGIVRSQHGRYELLGNGSIILNPFPEDGRIQVQDTCPQDGVSNVILQFNVTVLFRSWRIFQDPVDGFKLHLFAFDGIPQPPMFLVQKDPIMLAKKSLVNAAMNITSTPTPNKVTKRSDAAPVMVVGMKSVWMVLAGLMTLGVAVVL